MPESKADTTAKAAAKAENSAVPEAVGDRVAMLSLSKDGTPDQVNPEIIGDKTFAVEAAKRQFAEQAVSAADDAKRVEDAKASAGADDVDQDPEIQARIDEHKTVSEAAEKRAEAVVESLSK